MCAGILSSRTVHGLDTLKLALPPDVVMGRINVYTLHWNNQHIPIAPPDATRQVLSVYRSGGPRHSPFAPVSGFDQFLLDQARARGAQVLHERVEKISFASQPRVTTSARAEEFDLVVLATGVNALPPAFENLAYHPPITETMAQDELVMEHLPRAEMNSAVHIFFDQPRDLLFGALIPKGHFVNVSLLGTRLDRASVQQFLTDPQVARVIGQHPPQACGCQPRIAASPAQNFFADRFVAIGDACVTRLYKDGIGSALITARTAAETALTRGIHRAAFATHYAPVCRAIARDNRLGRAVFALTGASRRSPLLMRTLARALAAETHQAPRDRLTSQVLWSLFTGDADYSEIFKMMLHPQRIARLSFAMLQEIIRKKTK
jgi:flavin-dependent dehydrogenase